MASFVNLRSAMKIGVSVLL
uniref:Uncharacterized protein n=1 Tax=Lepeophtheirus salmonis TaxID=72036 RepID=A0A0K2UU12_LEPSM